MTSVAGLLAERERLRQALAPFAAAAGAFAGRPESLRLLSSARGDILVSDLRRAAEVVAKEHTKN